MKFDVVETTESNGNVMKKHIEAGNEAIALKLLQKTSYTSPTRSIIRELASNGKDSIKDRDVALSILAGTTTVEDHYDVTKVGDIYKASQWDADYYNPDYLSNDPNVYITIESQLNNNILTIKDNGVGLGGDRLRGFFQLNFSTKRTNKDVLGAFGLGSKVALSKNDEFDVVTRYNGKTSRFRVTLDTVIPLTPKFSNGKMNELKVLVPEVPERIEIQDGKEVTIPGEPAITAYWEDTDEPNGMSSILKIKKSETKDFVQAAKSQLMYMPNVQFKVQSDGGSWTTEDISAEIMYRDGNCVISKNSIYTVPHILLGAGDTLINYGPIDFEELEKEPKSGSVGLIVDASAIDVTPNRETIVWNDKASAEVTKRYDIMAATAKEYIESSLDNIDDFVEWLHVTSVTTGNVQNLTSNSAVAAFSKVIQVTGMDAFPYPNDPNIKFFRTLDRQFGTGTSFYTYQGGAGNRITTAGRFVLDSMYYMDVPRDSYKFKYLEATNGAFTYFFIKDETLAENNEMINMLLDSKYVKLFSEVTIPDDVLQAYKDADAAKQPTTEDGTPVVRVKDTRATYKLYNGSSFNMYKSNAVAFKADPFKTIGYSSSDSIVLGTAVDREDLMRAADLINRAYALDKLFFTGKDRIYWSNNVRNAEHNRVAVMMVNKDLYKGMPLGNRLKTLKDFYIKSYKNGVITLNDSIAFLLTHNYIAKTAQAKDHRETFANFSYWGKTANNNVDYSDIYGVYACELNNVPQWLQIMSNIALINAGLKSDEGDKQKLLDQLDICLPDFLCDEIDAITDVIGFNKAYYDDVMENVLGVYTKEELQNNYLISNVSDFVLNKINYKFGLEHDKIQKGFDPKGKILLGQAIPKRFGDYFTKNLYSRWRYTTED